MTPGQRLGRVATDVVVRAPALWPLFRPLLRRQFDALAPVWDERRTAQRQEPLEAALERAAGEPERALDLGTGTGAAAFLLARRWPAVDVVGADVSEGMLARARAKTPPELRGRVRFERADAARLPYADASFDLVTLLNMIPFPRELARVLRPEGQLVVAFSSGPETPIYVAPARLRRALARHGVAHVADVAAGAGEASIFRRGA